MVFQVNAHLKVTTKQEAPIIKMIQHMDFSQSLPGFPSEIHAWVQQYDFHLRGLTWALALLSNQLSKKNDPSWVPNIAPHIRDQTNNWNQFDYTGPAGVHGFSHISSPQSSFVVKIGGSSNGATPCSLFRGTGSISRNILQGLRALHGKLVPWKLHFLTTEICKPWINSKMTFLGQACKGIYPQHNLSIYSGKEAFLNAENWGKTNIYKKVIIITKTATTEAPSTLPTALYWSVEGLLCWVVHLGLSQGPFLACPPGHRLLSAERRRHVVSAARSPALTLATLHDPPRHPAFQGPYQWLSQSSVEGQFR